MKKILLVLSMLLLVCSCGTPQAQKDFESMFKALQSGDVKKMNQINPDAKISENDENVKIFLDGYKKISYKINKTENLLHGGKRFYWKYGIKDYSLMIFSDTFLPFSRVTFTT